VTASFAASILDVPTLEDFDAAALAAANICPATGLATDYLNHFNEVAMLLDMLAMMPEASEDILAWRPFTYAEHFHATGYRDKELAIAAYEAAPSAIKERFHAACADVEMMVASAQELIETGSDPESFASPYAAIIFEQIGLISLIVNGGVELANDDDANDAQADIDALFD
jgi:hypothetical protein